MTEQMLTNAIAELRQAVAEFRKLRLEDYANLLERIAYQLDAEPLNAFLASLGETAGFAAWLDQASQSVRGSLRWPLQQETRVLYRVAVCRQLGNGATKALFDFAMKFTRRGASTDVEEIIASFRDAILEPLVNDLSSLAQRRPLSPAVAQVLRDVPRSGDAAFDALVVDACARFRESGPTSLRDAVEKLWDAWERIKTIPHTDKKRSLDALIDRSADSDVLKAVLHADAKALKDIGNDFTIRHFETNKTPITQPYHLEYLFLRMLAMLRLLIRALP